MHDAQIRVAIAGAGGRMGRQLIQAALQMDGVALGAALEREGSSLVGSDAGELAGAGKAGVTVQSSLTAVKDDFDVLIDFTRPEGTLNHLAFCRDHGKGMVIGTTGLTTPASRRFAMPRRRLPLSSPLTLASASTSC
jgi:4-hydroxy-tetrahydrodipicolinate reductase